MGDPEDACLHHALIRELRAVLMEETTAGDSSRSRAD
jgi:hypothetical protein